MEKLLAEAVQDANDNAKPILQHDRPTHLPVQFRSD
jgi:hypothetical protein